MAATLPESVSDVIMHAKPSDTSEQIVLPVTRYDNIMNAPHIIENAESKPGAPFHFLMRDTEVLTVQEIRALCGSIL